MTFIAKYLSDKLSSKANLVEEWLQSKLNKAHKLVYSSVDIRNSGYKLVPVDANLFPAGFNNLSESAKIYAAGILKEYFDKFQKIPTEIIIIAESHTRNSFYISNLLALYEILIQAGTQVIFATLDEEEIEATSNEGKKIIFKPLAKISLEGKLVILNNDLTNGPNEILKSSSSLILPPYQLGWYQRKKSKFFEIYEQVTSEFAKEFGLDSFYFNSMVLNCQDVNFKTSSGVECIALKIEKTIHLLKEKYREYNIKQEPYVIVKSNSGTYGMSVMAAHSGDDIIQMNKKKRNKMNSGKGGIATDNVIIQEGIETIEHLGENVAESMIYSVAAKPVSLIYRMHGEKGSKSNLNSVGMSFKEMDSGCRDHQFYYHYLVVKLTNIALINEINYYEGLNKND